MSSSNLLYVIIGDETYFHTLNIKAPITTPQRLSKQQVKVLAANYERVPDICGLREKKGIFAVDPYTGNKIRITKALADCETLEELQKRIKELDEQKKANAEIVKEREKKSSLVATPKTPEQKEVKVEVPKKVIGQNKVSTPLVSKAKAVEEEAKKDDAAEQAKKVQEEAKVTSVNNSLDAMKSDFKKIN